MNKTRGIIAAITLALAASGAAHAQTLPEMRLRMVSVVASFPGSGSFRNLRGMWYDRDDNTFYLLDEDPLTAFKFDRFVTPLKYYVMEEPRLSGAILAGAAGDQAYVNHREGSSLLTSDFSEVRKTEFFFKPPEQKDVEPELIPLKFKFIFPGGDGKPLYGFDPEKKILYECAADGACRVFIRTMMKYGADVLTGNMRSVTRDKWGRFFFVDEQARQVWRFSAAGRFEGAAGRTIDAVRDRLYQPELIAVDRMRQCYIYDAGTRLIKIYDDLGLPVGEINVNPATGPLFVFPSALEIDDLNRMYVLDTGDMTMKIFEITN